MAGPKGKKQQKRGVDFKKIKRKIGKKLPPAKNATNTEIKSKAIILPEQSVASEKAGLAVNKRGLTLKELLQQTSHYSSKVRKEALLGIKDLFEKYPEELRLHKYAVIEKLRERIGDDDRVAQKTLHELFKSAINAGCKEDNQELFVSLMMPYIFNAMTHLAIDVRLMAFEFWRLSSSTIHLPFSCMLKRLSLCISSQQDTSDLNLCQNVLPTGAPAIATQEDPPPECSIGTQHSIPTLPFLELNLSTSTNPNSLTQNKRLIPNNCVVGHRDHHHPHFCSNCFQNKNETVRVEILQNFEDILRRNQFYLEDKKKLKTALAGLEQCLSLLPCNKREVSSLEKNDAGQRILHAFEPDLPAKSAGCSDIIPKLKDLVPVLVNCFQDFIPEVQTGSLLDKQSFDCSCPYFTVSTLQ
ncbi:uncharacterized protein Pyn_03782 [Prunus yedoensis var. nudiflora]|uniref:Testis-expressed sequence 10 protein homolog n=1 Tax=Prunus yedoensis var. nudiflora TaxID=2094558 RepID=A0A314V1Z2_PRUYE|nr:uncharacterized protein Pyn_03782 [Prunus yedoensis var. nudiflora]